MVGAGWVLPTTTINYELSGRVLSFQRHGETQNALAPAVICQFHPGFLDYERRPRVWPGSGRLCDLTAPGASSPSPHHPRPFCPERGFPNHTQTDKGLLPLCLSFLLHHLLLLGCDEQLCLLAFPEGRNTGSREAAMASEERPGEAKLCRGEASLGLSLSWKAAHCPR